MSADYPLIVHCHLCWDWVWQRPQQFISRLAQRHPVLFVETLKPDGELVTPVARYRKANNAANVTLLSLQFPGWRWNDAEYVDAERRRLVKEFLSGPGAGQFEQPVQWFYDPMAVPAFAGQMDEVLTVYDCMDELSKFRYAPPEILAREKALLERADVVFTGGRKLFEAKSQFNDNCHFYGCGVDGEHFGKARASQTAVAPELAKLRKPVLGYIGVIDERLDFELLGKLAEANPKWSIAMVGPVIKVEDQVLPKQPNIHWLGQKSYEELPLLAKGFDLCLMPFALNEATEYINPTKALEYMATGRQIVSTPVADVVRNFGSVVKIGKNAGEFISLCRRALEAPDAGAVARGLDMAAENSWDSIVARLEEHVENALEKKRQSQPRQSKVTVPDAVLTAGSNGNGHNGKHDGNGNGDGNGKINRNELGLKKKYEGRAEPERLKEIKGNGKHGSPTPVANGESKANTDEEVEMKECLPERRSGKVEMFDYLIVGAGFAGSVIAERLARGSGKKVLLVDRRSHIGGNAYDHYDDAGILVHKYGPHIFHTNSKEIFEYLSRFTQWRHYQHKVLASVDGQLVPIPINLDTINKLYGLELNAFQVEEFLASRAEHREHVRTSEDVVVSKVGRELYEKFFRGYTRKQWGLDPSELDSQVTARVPTRTNRDDRYFTDTYQSMPKHGFTRMFQNMLDHPNIKIMLNTDYRDVKEAIPYRELVFTGPVDEYFDYRFGKLPYRCLEFKHETLNVPQYQPVAVVNYPNDYAFTRVTEFKYLTGQEHPKTSIVYEYPQAEGDPYYPIPRAENAEIYKQYQELAEATGVHFVGRLATYKYYNMDQVVAQALTVYARLTKMNRVEAASLQTEPPVLTVTFPLNAKPKRNGQVARRREKSLTTT